MPQIAYEIWLWNEVRYGNEEALFKLYMNYYRHFYRYGLHISADRAMAMECINETFTDVWMRRERLPEVESAKGYLFVIYKRKLFQRLKKAKKSPVFSREDDFTAVRFERSYEYMLIASQKEKEMKIHIQKAINKLTPRQKEFVRMRYFDNLTIEEIAEVKKRTLRTVYNTLHEAVETLRKELGKKK